MAESVIKEAAATNNSRKLWKLFREHYLDGQTKLGEIELVARLIEPPSETNDILHEFGKINDVFKKSCRLQRRKVSTSLP